MKYLWVFLPPKPLSVDIWWHLTVHWWLQHGGECNPVYLCMSHLHCKTPAASQPPSVLKNGIKIYKKDLNRIYNCNIHHFLVLENTHRFFKNVYSFYSELCKLEYHLPWYAAQWTACLSFLSLACTLAPLFKSKLTICKIYCNSGLGLR